MTQCAAEQQLDGHVVEVLGGALAALEQPDGGGEQAEQGLGEPDRREVDAELAALLAAPEQCGDAGVDPGPAVVLLLALEQLVLRVEEGEEPGSGFDLADQTPYGITGRPLVQAGGVERLFALLDAQRLQCPHERV